MKLPTTLPEAQALIIKLDRELVALKTQIASRGIPAELLRTPENFRLIDKVLEEVQYRPFSLTEVYNKWLDLTQLSNENQKLLTDLRQHFTYLLKLNGFIHQVGGKGRSTLWRLNQSYNFILRSTNSLKWRSLGQVEGTYLVPSSE